MLPSTPPAGAAKKNSAFERVMGNSAGPRPDAPFFQRVLTPLADRLLSQGSLLMKGIDSDDVRYRLMRAGFPSNLRARDFIALKWLMVFALAFIMPVCLPVFFVSILGWEPAFWMTVAGIVIGALYGWKLPDTWLAMKTKQRQFEIQMVLPDMIDLITVAVEAGLGLYAAIQRISAQFPNPLSDEFNRALQEVRLGRSNAQALRDLSDRVDLQDLSTLITALVQAELLGIAIANVLRIQSERLRDIRMQRAREQAQKAPIKLMFPLVLFIFPALFVVILGPALIRFIENPF